MRVDQERDRKAYAERQKKTLVPYAQAFDHRFQTDWQNVDVPTPSFTGARTIESQPLDELVPYIDWSPFFQTWELRGKYPAILNDEHVGAEAKKLFDDALRLLDEIVEKKLLIARGVYGFWPAHSVGDEIIVSGVPEVAEGRQPPGRAETQQAVDRTACAVPLQDGAERTVLCHFPMLRQQWERQGQSDFRSLADYIAPADSGRTDYLGAFAVTTGHGCDELAEKFLADHDDYHSIMTKALADRLAEAFAEKLHADARRDWGYGQSEGLSNDELIAEKYRGIRPAFGYPACPDHTLKRTLFDLLDAESQTGISLTESFAMYPTASVSGLYFAHPESRYFSVDRITRDQVEEYARHKGMSIHEVERWLAPNLGYEP